MSSNQMFESVNHYLAYMESHSEAIAAIRSPPKYEDLNYLGCPYESSLKEYQLFKDYKFNFGTYEKMGKYQNRTPMSSEAYAVMREDFESNGAIVDDTDEGKMQQSEVPPFFCFGDSDFPPLELPSEQTLFPMYSVNEVVVSMQSLNVVVSGNTSDQDSTKRRRPDKKSLEDVGRVVLKKLHL